MAIIYSKHAVDWKELLSAARAEHGKAVFYNFILAPAQESLNSVLSAFAENHDFSRG